MQADRKDTAALPILVTGGTGTLGRQVVTLLHQAGRDVRVLSRKGPRDGSQRDGQPTEFVRGDLCTGEGIDSAVQGAGIVVHCAGDAKGDEDKARHLVHAASNAGVRHLVFISVVGADRIPVVSPIDRAMFGYFASKRAAERIVADCGLPWTTLRATQFHDLTFQTVQAMAKLPLIPVPSGFRFQPVDSREVAERLVELTLGTPAGLVPDMGGPRVYEMGELVRSYLQATHRHRFTLGMWLPGRAARAFRAGANLVPERAVGRRTWEEFLAAHVSPRGESRSVPPAKMRPVS